MLQKLDQKSAYLLISCNGFVRSSLCLCCPPYLILFLCCQRIDRIHSTISSDLDHVFAVALVALTGEGKVIEMEKTKLLQDVTDCLKTYDLLGLWRDAEDVLRKEVVRAFVKKASSMASSLKTC